MNAACGPYIAAWQTSPPTAASTISAVDFVSSSGKKANTQIAAAAAPARYTGRRPTRSDRWPK